jgi:ATPase subunit of ABC transporter with duplicated ATPase domains
MGVSRLEFIDVTFFYESAGAPVFEGLSVEVSGGWTGIIGANGAGKTTLLRLACGDLTPTRGKVVTSGTVIWCPQRTDDPPQALREFLDATDGRAGMWRGRLGIQEDWLQRWETLSHGERKRAQIAVALWRRPRLLAVDEPTNHVDAPTRDLLAEALSAFRGVGLLVSHDRALLDSLCRQCLFMTPPTAVLRPGGYTQAEALAREEQERLRKLRETARSDLDRLRSAASQRRQEASGSHRQRSKRKLARHDHDGRAKRNAARISGKDGQAGRLLRGLDGRLRQVQERLEGARVTRQPRLGIDLSAARSPRDALFRIPATSIPLGPHRTLSLPDLEMGPEDRIALVGPNGCGKSTLIRHILDQLDLPEGRLVYLAQEIDRQQSRAVLAEVRGMAPERLGQVLSIVDCLGSSPQRVLETDQPSPGETRKLLLAMGLARTPHLIIMDEPTNHLDLPSITCLEEALGAVPCGLLLVSHDVRFLEALTHTTWSITPTDGPQMFLQAREGRLNAPNESLDGPRFEGNTQET